MNRRSFFGFAIAPLGVTMPLPPVVAPAPPRNLHEYPCNNHDHCGRCGGCGHNTGNCPSVRCQLCGQQGHEAETGVIRLRRWDWDAVASDYGNHSMTAWCPNAPVNWDVYELVA